MAIEHRLIPDEDLHEIKGAVSASSGQVPVANGAGSTSFRVLVPNDINGLSDVASSGAYGDLSGRPDLAAVATSGDYNDLSNTPSLSTVATSGEYSDLTGTPSLSPVATSGSYNDLSNTPNLSTVATSGEYSDLSGTPSLSAVATSGSYNDLADQPTILDSDDVITIVASKAEIAALTPIADPTTATAEDVANAVNDIIAALQAGV